MAETLASILESMGKLEAGQGAILTELKGPKERQDATDSELKRPAERLRTLETKACCRNAPRTLLHPATLYAA
ncbi:hypothetical protein HPB48_007192 [Haemaphysalis longicornis]|uniref:Uncharacterized protein n=1 Tax=Haemaphysalis longicornis TaxID=44386 RepID=A0A9J6FTD5_HAELO|nr:hypothetical protein HPB48_007192 [Haemaphysalis longicornis]